MNTQNNKYDKLLETLRKSKPVFNDFEAVSERIIREIQKENSSFKLWDLMIEFFFGWVYIGWVRKSMVAAAMIIIVFFGYQQTLILQKINDLPAQSDFKITPAGTNSRDEVLREMMLYRLKGKKLSEKEIIVSEKEIDQLIKSVNKLQLKYHDLFYLIENDPELKKYVETKMNETRKN